MSNSSSGDAHGDGPKIIMLLLVEISLSLSLSVFFIPSFLLIGPIINFAGPAGSRVILWSRNRMTHTLGTILRWFPDDTQPPHLLLLRGYSCISLYLSLPPVSFFGVCVSWIERNFYNDLHLSTKPISLSSTFYYLREKNQRQSSSCRI